MDKSLQTRMIENLADLAISYMKHYNSVLNDDEIRVLIPSREDLIFETEYICNKENYEN